MATFRIGEAAGLLGVSDATVRRRAAFGRIPTSTDTTRRVIDGLDLASFSRELVTSGARPTLRSVIGESAG